MSRQTDRQLQRIHGLPGTPVIIEFDGSVATASALNAGDTYMLQCTEDCHVTFALAPTAATTDTILFAGVPYPFTVLDNGVALKCAAIKATGASAGKLFITPMSGVHA